MPHKAMRHPAWLVLLVLALARTAVSQQGSQDGTDLPPMNPPVIDLDNPDAPLTYTWPYEGPWPLSDEADGFEDPYEGPWPLSDEADTFEDPYTADYDSFSQESNTLSSPSAGIGEQHRKLTGFNDMFKGINDFFVGIKKGSDDAFDRAFHGRRKVLQAVTPTDIQPGEVVPEVVAQQQEATKKAEEQAAQDAASGKVVLASVPADVVTVAFSVPGMAPDQFNQWHLQTVITTIAQMTGTPSDQWKSTVVAKSSRRVLLQSASSSAGSAVSLSILTRNPQLVVFRLGQAPSASASATAGGSSTSACTNELCTRLVAVGVPIAPGSVLITPDYSSVLNFGTPAANQVDEQLENRRRLGAIVGGAVGGFMLLILLLLTYKKFIACFKGRIAAVKARKQHKPSQKDQQQNAGLPKIAPDSLSAGPKAEPPVKFLSISGSVTADQMHHGGSNLLKHGSISQHSASGSSSGIPTGPSMPVNGSSITPWAEVDEVSSMPVPPTAASLAAAAEQQQHAGNPLYRDSDSFKCWAAAAAMSVQGGHGAAGSPGSTPSSHGSISLAARGFEEVPRPISPATAANLAAAMPGSPISSPMYQVRHHTSSGSSPTTMHRNTPVSHYPAGSPVQHAATIDARQLKQILDAYYLEQQQMRNQQQQQQGANRGRANPASPVAAAGWLAASEESHAHGQGSSYPPAAQPMFYSVHGGQYVAPAGAATAAARPVVPPTSPRGHLSGSRSVTGGVAHSPMRPSRPTHRRVGSEPAEFFFHTAQTHNLQLQQQYPAMPSRRQSDM